MVRKKPFFWNGMHRVTALSAVVGATWGLTDCPPASACPRHVILVLFVSESKCPEQTWWAIGTVGPWSSTKSTAVHIAHDTIGVWSILCGSTLRLCLIRIFRSFLRLNWLL